MKPCCVITAAACLSLAVSAIAPGRCEAAKKKHQAEVESWQVADISPHSILIIEDFAVTDPKADERKKSVLVKSAPRRVADYLASVIDPELFVEVRRGPAEPISGAVVLRVSLTQYKPGSEVSRMMLIGTGVSHIDFEATVIDAVSGQSLARFSDSRSWGWGGALGASKGIDDMEQNVAMDLAQYLERCRTLFPHAQASTMISAVEGPADEPAEETPPETAAEQAEPAAEPDLAAAVEPVDDPAAEAQSEAAVEPPATPAQPELAATDEAVASPAREEAPASPEAVPDGDERPAEQSPVQATDPAKPSEPLPAG